MEIVKNFNARLIEMENEYVDERKLLFKPVDSVLSIEALRRRLPISIPDELVAMWMNTGAFESAFFADCWQTICVFSARELVVIPCGLIDFIDHIWGGRPEFVEYFNSEETQAFNERCVVFGYRYIDDNVHTYFYFDRTGKFGCLHFDQDDGSSWEPGIRNLLNDNVKGSSLSVLLQDQFDIVCSTQDD